MRRLLDRGAFGALLLTLAACTADLDEECLGGPCCVDKQCPGGASMDHHHDGMPTGAECPAGSKLSFPDFGRDFMKRYCLGCHSDRVTGQARMGAPVDKNFDRLEEIRADAEEIDMVGAAGPDAVNTHMPPAEPLPSLQDRLQLGEWLACGAPQGPGVTK